MLNLKRIHKTICASILAVSMMLPGMTAYAAKDITSPSAGDKAQEIQDDTATGILRKVVTSSDGVTYENLSCTFTFAQEDEFKDNGETANETKVAIPAITISGISQDGRTTVSDTAGGTNVQNMTTGQWERTINVDLDLSAFQVPGIYTYRVTENEGDATGVTYSQANYRLRVYVEDLGYDETSGEFKTVKTVTCEMIKDQYGKKAGDSNDVGKKVDVLEFDNTYKTTDHYLYVTKYVKGYEATAAKSNGYTFTITNQTKDTKSFPTTITGYILENGEQKPLTTSLDGTTKITFTLKGGQTAVFTNLPVGMKVKVGESKTQLEGYNVTKIGLAYNKTGAKDETKDPDTVDNNHEVSNIQIVDGGTYVTFTNIYEEQEMIVTGVVTDIAPYITIVVLAIAGIAAYIIIRRRMR